MDLKALMDLSYGMYVLSTKYNDKDVGCFVNTVTQITAENPIISVSVNKDNYTNEAIRKNRRFAVSILSENTNKEVIGKFGFFSSKDTDKFSEFKTRKIEDILVLDENICGYVICELINIVDVETHDIFIARVIDSVKVSEEIPMTYSYYHNVIKGKSPKKAPTYVNEDKEEDGNKYKCIVCGHIYDETIEKIKFDELPTDWKCPICGVGKNMFKRI